MFITSDDKKSKLKIPIMYKFNIKGANNPCQGKEYGAGVYREAQ